MLLEGARARSPCRAAERPAAGRPRCGSGRDRDRLGPPRAHLARARPGRAPALAGGYRGLGLEPGDRVASLMPNRVDLVVHYLACFRAGLIATPLNYRYTAREIDHALRGERRQGPARPRRAGRGRRRQRARRRPGAGDDRLPRRRAAADRQRGARRGRRRLAPRLRRAPRLRAPAPRTRAARPRGAGRDLLHLGQHRPRQGRHPLRARRCAG